MGTSALAGVILKSLIKEKYNIVSVFTQPDRDKKKESAVKKIAEAHKININQPEKLDETVISLVKNLKPDLIIVAAYGKILPKKIIETPGLGSLNVHASLLPKFRGPSPIQNALLAGEEKTGVTIMLMDEGIDTGDILAQEEIKISPEDNLKTLSKKISTLGAKLLIESISRWIERKLKRIKQDDFKATVCQLIERNDGRIFWNEKAENIYNKFRAFYPWPGIFSFWEKDNFLKRIKFCEIKLKKNDSHERAYSYGKVFKSGEAIGIQAPGGIIVAEIIQMEGKKPLPAKDFIIGHPDFIGSVLK